MKIALGAILILASCKGSQQRPCPPTVHDTIYVTATCPPPDTIFQPIQLPSNVDKQIDSMKDELTVARFALVNIQHYLSITRSNANNRSFFLGWIGRAMDNYNAQRKEILKAYK